MLDANTDNRSWITTAALFGMTGVILGAFGSHGLRHLVSAELLSTWRTAVEYQMFHALALLAVGTNTVAARWRWPLRLWSAGIVLFSGSLYALVLTGTRNLGAITPIGGLSFIAGWAMVVVSAWGRREVPPT